MQRSPVVADVMPRFGMNHNDTINHIIIVVMISCAPRVRTVAWVA
jgi:hypothetical protein